MGMNVRPAPAPAGSGLLDEEIVRRVLEGEVELFELLMRRHNQTLYRAVRSLLRDETDVEDAMQQAYLLAFSRLATFAGTARFSTWLVRIGINEGLGRRRRERRFVALDGGLGRDEEEKVMPASSAPSPEDDASSHELAVLIERAADELPEIYRSVFVLRDVEGMSTEDVASALDTSEDVVRTRLHRARAMLDERLRDVTRAPPGESFRFFADRCNRVVGGVMAAIRSPNG